MKVSKRVISMLLVVVLIFSATSISVFAKGDIKYGMAFVNGAGLRLRSQANTSSKILDSASKGEVVVVISKVGAWYKVIYDLQTGYMHGDYLKVRTTENVELGYGKVNGNLVNLRTGPSTSYKAVAQGNKGDKAYIIGINNGWYKVIFGEKICYIRSDYLDLTEVPYENNASDNAPLFFRGGKSTGVAPSAAALKGNSGNTQTPSTPSTPINSKGAAIVNKAKQYLGVPYVWGGTTPNGFDCSGFVYYVHKSLGYPISRMLLEMYAQGTKVAKADLQPGDIVFFQGTYTSGVSHAGIYVGNGQFIHSPHSGSVVSYADLNSAYYTSHYYGACRMY